MGNQPLMPNPVVSWQIISRDPGATADFYAKLFAWRVSQQNALGYREITTGGVDGGVWPAPPQLERPFVQLFVEVDDVDAYIAKAETLGAVTIVPRSVLPDGDAMAVLHDPAGMSFAICARKGRAKPE
jgi:uncharacterized protein